MEEVTLLPEKSFQNLTSAKPGNMSSDFDEESMFDCSAGQVKFSFVEGKNKLLVQLSAKLMRLGVANQIVVVKSNLKSKFDHQFRSDSKSNDESKLGSRF